MSNEQKNNRIVRMTAENVKRIKVVEIAPDGSVVTIGGNNGQGKTSVLDSIEMALAGASAVPSMPIRAGEDSARIVLELDDIVVTRTFSGGKTQLVVTNKADGSIKKKPQAILDALCSAIGFDPHDFVRMNPAKQAEVLSELVGVDLENIDGQIEAATETRRNANREYKALQARADANPPIDIDVDEEVSLSEITEAINSAEAHNRKLSDLNDAAASKLEAIAELENRIAELRRSAEESSAKAEAMSGMKQVEPLYEQLKSAEKTNAAVRHNRAWLEITNAMKSQSELAEVADETIDRLRAQRAEMIAGADYPIQGLAVDGKVVTYNGVPFDQCSSAEQIRVSLAMGLSMSKGLPVILIRDGSLLDNESMGEVRRMAEKADAQVWVEVVEDGADVSVVIDDGCVKADR